MKEICATLFILLYLLQIGLGIFNFGRGKYSESEFLCNTFIPGYNMYKEIKVIFDESR